MREFLILKLQGPMQAWGEHTFEGLRPSGNFPTRSGVLGLLGACLGIRRNEPKRLQGLADSVGMAVRVDERPQSNAKRFPGIVKITDYHTVQDARVEYSGLKSHETIQTWREYLMDAQFTVALWSRKDPHFSLAEIGEAVQKPVFTPFLGRRSCPLGRPLFEACLNARNVLEALRIVPPAKGAIYSEEGPGVRMMRLRDVPLVHQPRQFASRNVFVTGGGNVPE